MAFIVRSLALVFIVQYDMVVVIKIYILGQTYQLDRKMETSKFECPHCSQDIDSIRSIQKHCKDHVADSSIKHVTGHYHPYATTSDNTEHTKSTNDTSKENATHDTPDIMDIKEGIF